MKKFIVFLYILVSLFAVLGAANYSLEREMEKDIKRFQSDTEYFSKIYETPAKMFEINPELVFIPLMLFFVVWVLLICMINYFVSLTGEKDGDYYAAPMLSFLGGAILIATLCSLDIQWAYRIMDLF